ncbi:MAG: hypothetical protein KBC96_07000 [Armatimonadetes bacterium]|nr:hypothetical protein [Armatimonadota bacterium]
MKRLVLAACLLGMLSTTAFCASDPDEKPEPDARLDQKVTIKAVGKPLGDFLREVTAGTGVKMVARKDAADIKVAVFIKDTPLSSLRDALKDCLHLMCTREGRKDEWIYNFWEDMKTRQAAERIKQEEVEKLHAHIDMLAQQIADIEAEGKDPASLAKEFNTMAPQQREKLMREDPDRYAAFAAFGSYAGTLAAVTAYTGLGQTQAQALWAGQKVAIHTVDMATSLRQRFETRSEALTSSIRANEWRFPDQQPLPDEIGGLTLQLEMTSWQNKPCLTYMFEYVSDNGEIAGGAGSVISVPLDQPEAESTAPTDADSAPDTRPDLKLKIASRTTLYEVMEQVFDVTGTCVISDYYTRVKQPGIITGILTGDHPAFKTADDVLDQAARDTRSIVGRSGEIRIFSSRQWPSDRDREIPERLLARWRAARDRYGGVRLQDAFEMANLSRLQLEDLEMYKTGYGWAIISCQGAIRVAGSLTAGQWQAAVSETGLSTSEMSVEQLALVQDWAKDSENYRWPVTLSEELTDLWRLRSCTLKIVYRGRGDRDDAIKAEWDFELYPPSYYEAIRNGASEAASRGEEAFAVPGPECCGLFLAELNQPRGWPSPSDEEREGTPASK